MHKNLCKNRKFLNQIKKYLGKDICIVVFEGDVLFLSADEVIDQIQQQTLLGKKLFTHFCERLKFGV